MCWKWSSCEEDYCPIKIIDMDRTIEIGPSGCRVSSFIVSPRVVSNHHVTSVSITFLYFSCRWKYFLEKATWQIDGQSLDFSQTVNCRFWTRVASSATVTFSSKTALEAKFLWWRLELFQHDLQPKSMRPWNLNHLLSMSRVCLLLIIWPTIAKGYLFAQYKYHPWKKQSLLELTLRSCLVAIWRRGHHSFSHADTLRLARYQTVHRGRTISGCYPGHKRRSRCRTHRSTQPVAYNTMSASRQRAVGCSVRII